MRLNFFIIYMTLFSLIAGCASNAPAPVTEKKIPADKSTVIQKNKSVARAKKIRLSHAQMFILSNQAIPFIA